MLNWIINSLSISTLKPNPSSSQTLDHTTPNPSPHHRFTFQKPTTNPSNMYKNKLQELSQRSCFNLPSYTCIRQGPDHAPRFKATVNFNGEVFESVNFCSTLRQAEHSAAEVALNSLSNRGSSYSLAARILDETGVYKNLLQEISQRVGAPLPRYFTRRTGLGHLPVFSGMVEIGGIVFTGETAKNKKQAEKNAALAAWQALKQLAKETPSTETENPDEQEQVSVARAFLKYRLKERLDGASSPNCRSSFSNELTFHNPRPFRPQSSTASTSKILPLINSNKSKLPEKCNAVTSTTRQPIPPQRMTSPAFQPMHSLPETLGFLIQKFPAAGAAPYIPIRNLVTPYRQMAPTVSIRTAVPCFSAPYMPPPGSYLSPLMHAGPAPAHFSHPITFSPRVPVFDSTVKAQAPVITGNNPLDRAVESITTAAGQDIQRNESTEVHLHN